MTDAINKPMQGLASYLRCTASDIPPGHPSHETLRKWANEVEAALAAPPEPQPVKQAQQCGKRIRDLALELEKTGRIISCLTVDSLSKSQERTDMVARNRGIQCAMEDAINELVELAARGGEK